MKKLLLFAALAGATLCANGQAISTTFEGFPADNSNNLWKTATVNAQWGNLTDGSWSDITPQPSINVTSDGVSTTLPENAGWEPWQVQLKITTNISISASKKYDFSVIINSTKSSNNVLFKLYTGNDDIFFAGGNDRVTLPEGKSCYFFSDQQGIDGDLILLLDLPGLGGDQLSLSNIVIREHEEDANVPAPTGPAANPNFDGFGNENNLWSEATLSLLTGQGKTYFAANGWSQLDNPDITIANGEISFTAPTDMGSEDIWQGQVFIGTNITVDASKKYDFSCTLEGSESSVGFKLQTEAGAALGASMDNNIIYNDICWYGYDLSGQTGNLVMIFACGGNPGVNFKISNIVFREHEEYVYDPDNDNSGSETPEQPGDDTENSGTITGIFTNTAEGDVDFTADWEGYTNEDMTITLDLTVDPYVEGLVPQLFVDNAHQGDFTQVNNTKAVSYWTYTTTSKYAVGDKPAFAIYFAYAGGSVAAQPIAYTVTAPEEEAGNNPSNPSNPTTPDSANNLWNKATVSLAKTFFANNDWVELDPQPEVAVSNEEISLTTPAGMGSSQWQGQVFVQTDITVTAGESYDFSCYIDTPKDAKITIKLDVNGEADFFIADAYTPNVKANGYEFQVVDQAYTNGPTGKLWLVFDFAGYPDQAFSFTDIVFAPTSKASDAVNSIESADITAPVEYYNLNGVRVAHPQHGIYIMRQGDKARKVMIK